MRKALENVGRVETLTPAIARLRHKEFTVTGSSFSNGACIFFCRSLDGTLFDMIMDSMVSVPCGACGKIFKTSHIKNDLCESCEELAQYE